VIASIRFVLKRHATLWSVLVSRPSIGKTPMTGAERQARYRAVQADGARLIRIRRPADRRSRVQRWSDAIAGLVDLQLGPATWLDAPPAKQDSATTESLQATVDFDRSELP
jgi:hypothetical protein